MTLGQVNFEGRDRVQVAIDRIRMFEPGEGYYLAFSGGKDSQCIYHLAKEAGVKFDAHFHFTTVDPPEVIRFIKEQYPDVEIEYPDMSMFQLIHKKGMPTRLSRFCCAELKEHGGEGRTVMLGIRWAESARRRRYKMVELCNKPTGRNLVSPIIDWSSKEVWEYLNRQRLPHCSLYDEGYKRIGCVLCPMASARQSRKEITRFPKLARAWWLACKKYYGKGLPGCQRWDSADDYWQWWLSRKGQRNKAQAVMFE